MVGEIGAAEVGAGEGADTAVEAVLAGEDVKGLGEVLHERTAPAAAVRCGVVQFAVGGLAQKGFDFPGTIRMDIALQPIQKEFLELIWKAQKNPRDARGPRVGHGFENGGKLGIGEAGDDRGDVDGDGNARGDKFTNGPQTTRGGRGTRLQFLCEVMIERHKRDGDTPGVLLGEFLPEIGVAQDERGFGHGGHRLSAIGHDFEALAGDPHFVFERLVNVGDGGHDDSFGLPSGVGEFALQQVGGVRLRHQFGFKIEPQIEPKIFVIRPGETINAAMLATAIGVERPIERHIGGGCNLINDGVGFVKKNLPFDARRTAFIIFLPFHKLAINLFTEDMQAHRLEAIAGVDPGPAPMGRPARKGVAV